MWQIDHSRSNARTHQEILQEHEDPLSIHKLRIQREKEKYPRPYLFQEWFYSPPRFTKSEDSAYREEFREYLRVHHRILR